MDVYFKSAAFDDYRICNVRLLISEMALYGVPINDINFVILGYDPNLHAIELAQALMDCGIRAVR